MVVDPKATNYRAGDCALRDAHADGAAYKFCGVWFALHNSRTVGGNYLAAGIDSGDHRGKAGLLIDDYKLMEYATFSDWPNSAASRTILRCQSIFTTSECAFSSVV